MVFIVILAGGGGERLWPKSRLNRPKQCISLDGKQSLIQRTYEMAVQIVGEENILVSTRKELAPLIREQLPKARLTTEPIGRDSAAGMGYVCAQLLSEEKDETTIFMGADYHIPDINHFKEVLKVAIQFAEENKISTIGIKPTRVETRFGYINPGKLLSHTAIHAYEVKEFTEKPDEVLAREYIAHGYLWNSGMFVVKPSVLYRNIRQYIPTLFQALEKIQKTQFNDKEAYKAFVPLPKVSIDYGVMEKTSDLVVVRGDFLWDDIGTWDSLNHILGSDDDGNIIQGDYMGIDVKNSVIIGDKPIIALGLSDLVVIDTEDCVFICHKDRAGDVKKIIKKLEKHPHLNQLLVI
ncbi:MAG: mannose-1-phosphate guanylyltransferase [Candidatus Hodarchaeales archaeon]